MATQAAHLNLAHPFFPPIHIPQTNLGANSLTGEDATLQPGDYRFLIRA